MIGAARALLGESLLAIRLVPVLCGLATLWLAAQMVRELGGGPFAHALAAAAVLVSGIHLALASFFSVNVLDLMWWAFGQLLLLRLLGRQSRARWAALAGVMGLGLLTKWSMLWFGFGLAAGILATDARRWLRTPAPWLAAAGALALASPYLFWQATHGWITLDWLAGGANVKLRDASLLDFLGNQILSVHPLNFPIWATGLAALLFAPSLARFRLLGVQAAVVLAFLAWTAPGIVHYPGPAYTVLLAAGAVVLERATRARWARRLARPAMLALLLLGGLVGLPLAVPVLPEDEVASYAAELGIQVPEPYGREHHTFPQQFSTMLGWEETVAATARVWKRFPGEARAGVAILGASYSDAGAVDLLGARYGLPRAISAHQSYWLWGPRDYDLETAIVVAAPPEILERWWREVEVAETVTCPRCELWRQEIHISIVRRPRTPIPALWDELRHY